MFTFKNAKAVWFVGAIAALMLLLQSPLPQPVFAEGNSGTPLQVQVRMEHLPTLGETTQVDCTAKAAKASPQTSVELHLPSNAELVSGSLQWQGKIKRNGSRTLSASIRFAEGGNASVSCQATRAVDENQVWGDLAVLYLNVGQTRTELGFAPEGNPYAESLGDGEGEPTFPSIDPNSFGTAPTENLEPPPSTTPMAEAESAPAVPDSPAGTVTIAGRWLYYDRADSLVAANQFLVEITNGAGTHIVYCNTNPSGYYSCGPFTNPGSAGILAKLRSYVNYSPYSDVLQVLVPTCGTSISCTYAASTGTYVFADGTHNIGSWSINNGSNIEGAFWIKDDLDRAWRYVWFGPGSSSSPQETAGPGTVLWSNSSTDGTYYSRGGQIHLMGQDRLSPDVVVHEYGHNVMYNIYHGSFPTTNCPSPHYVQYFSHANCAWTEGWADFLALPVNGDTRFTWPGGSFLDMETPTFGTAGWGNGDGVEGRVAGALWDILDNANDGTDTYSDGFNNIWDTIYHQTDNNFAEFWSAWKARGHNQAQAVQSIYQNTIDYRGSTPLVFVDAAWTADSSGTAKSSFVRGESIRYYAQFRNPGTVACPATATWNVKGGTTNIAYWSGPYNVGAGTTSLYLARTIPSDATLRKYKLKVTAGCNGQTSSQKYKFKIVSGSAAPQPVDTESGPLE